MTVDTARGGAWSASVTSSVLPCSRLRRVLHFPAVDHAPAPSDASPAAVDAFVARWDGTGLAERANYQLFLSELCDLLGVPRPEPATGSGGAYRFERGVTHREADGSTSSRRIDLYKRGCFVLEAKQGATPHRTQASLFPAADEAQHRANVRHTPGWARHMLAAKGQAENYAKDLPAAEGWPPFLIVCDVGFCLDLYADFSGTGKHYAQFPDRERFRLYLPDLRRAEVRARLRQVWEDPKALDPALLAPGRDARHRQAARQARPGARRHAGQAAPRARARRDVPHALHLLHVRPERGLAAGAAASRRCWNAAAARRRACSWD